MNKKATQKMLDEALASISDENMPDWMRHTRHAHFAAQDVAKLEALDKSELVALVHMFHEIGTWQISALDSRPTDDEQSIINEAAFVAFNDVLSAVDIATGDIDAIKNRGGDYGDLDDLDEEFADDDDAE